MVKLGYSTSAANANLTLKERIKLLLEVQSHAIELGFTRANRLHEEIDDEDIQNLKSFDHVSIHSPVVNSIDPETGDKTWIRYPSSETDSIVGRLLDLASKIDANFILFHPDLIDNFEWLNSTFGELLAFENMDNNKSFGSTINDLNQVFSKSPQAKWVCDVNHIYTIDNTMELTRGFHEAFTDRLAYYHLSAYGGFHDCFYRTGEDIILRGIIDYEKPIIHEGMALREGEYSLVQENSYILDKLELIGMDPRGT